MAAIELRGCSFVSPSHPAYVEGKRAVASLKVATDASTGTTVDEAKGGARAVTLEVEEYTITAEDGEVLASGTDHPPVGVEFGLVQNQYRKTGERVIRCTGLNHGGVFTTPCLTTAFRTFGSVWEAEPVEVVPPDTDVPGTGLLGRFWQNREFIGEPITELIGPPYRDDRGGSAYGPGSGLVNPPNPIDDQKDYSARWTGRLKFPETGQFRFSIEADDGFRVYINGRELLTSWRDNRDNQKTTGWLTQTAGDIVTIWVEFYSNNQQTSSLKIQWQTPSSPTVWKYPPLTLFYPTDGTEAPPTAAERPDQQRWSSESVNRYDV